MTENHIIHPFLFGDRRIVLTNNMQEVQNIAEEFTKSLSKFFRNEYEFDCKLKVFSVDYLQMNNFSLSLSIPTFFTEFCWFNKWCCFEINPELVYNGMLCKKNNKNMNPSVFEKSIYINFIQNQFLDLLYNSFNKEYQEEAGSIKLLPKIKNRKLIPTPLLGTKIKYSTFGILLTLDAEINKANGYINIFLDDEILYELNSLGMFKNKSENIIPLAYPKENLEMILGRCNLLENQKLIPGTLIKLNSSANQCLPIEYCDKQIAKGDPIVCDENLATRITELTEVPSKEDVFKKNCFNTKAVFAGKYIYNNEDIENLEEDTIIVMNQSEGASVRVFQADKEIATGDPIILGENYAVKIRNVW